MSKGEAWTHKQVAEWRLARSVFDTEKEGGRMLEPVELQAMQEKKASLMSAAGEMPVQGVEKFVTTALAFAKAMSPDSRLGLDVDTAAALNLFSQIRFGQDQSVFSSVNEALRDKDRNKIKRFCRFLAMLVPGMLALPRHKGAVWRAARGNRADAFPVGRKLFWAGFSPCAVDLARLNVDGVFSGTEERTLFHITTTEARVMGEFSACGCEEEAVLLPGLYLHVVSVSEVGNGLTIVQLRQIDPGYNFIDLVPKPVLSVDAPPPAPSFAAFGDEDPFSKLGLPFTPEARLHTETRPEDSRHAHHGVYFDIKAKAQPVTITSLFGGVTLPGLVSVFIVRGGCGDNVKQATEWTKVAEGSFGIRETNELRLNEPVLVDPFTSVGFYVHSADARVQFTRPTSGKKGEVHKENDYMSIRYGGTHMQRTAFESVQEGPVHMMAGSIGFKADALFAGIPKRIDTSKRPEDAGHSHRSVWFDVRAKEHPITITSIFGGKMEGEEIEVYASEGSGLDRATDRNSWRLVGKGAFQKRITTELVLNEPLFVPPHQSVGIYVHAPGGGRLQYNPADEDGKKRGEVHRENEDVALILGGCHLQDEPFDNARDGPVHIIAGGVGYTLGKARSAGRPKRIDMDMTPEESGHSHRSVWFDVRAKDKPITVTSVFGGVTDEDGPITIYHCAGGGLDHANDPNKWVKVGEGRFEKKKTTEIRLFKGVQVQAYESAGFYVHCHGGRVQYNKPSLGNKGDVNRENEDVAVLYGGCHMQDDAFVNANVGPVHMLAGGLGYLVVGDENEEGVLITKRINALTRPEDSDTGYHGVWFDVRARAKPITISSIIGGASEQGQVTVYSCSGPGRDRANDRGAWKEVGSGTFQSSKPSEIKLSTSVVVPPFGVAGIYVHSTGLVQCDRDDEGSSGDVHCENDEVLLICGGTHRQGEAFDNADEGSAHMIAGAVGYSVTVPKEEAAHGVPKRIDCLMDPKNSHNSHKSVWFDVRAKARPITITSIWGGRSQGTGLTTVYSCSGSGLDRASDPKAWTKVGEGIVEDHKATEIKLDTPVSVPPYGSVGIYLHCKNGHIQYDEADKGKKGEVHVEDEDVALIYGGCHLQEDPFVNPSVGPMHILAGGLGYSVRLAADEEEEGMVKRLDGKMTPEDSGNSHRSVWFDLKAKGKPLTISSLFGGVRAAGPIWIYSCQGSGIDRADNPAVWTKVGEGTYKERKTSEIKLSAPISVPAHGTVGVYVHCHGGRVQYDKANAGSKGEVHSENDDLAMIYGGCHLQDDPFVNPNVGPIHIIAGGVGYKVSSGKGGGGRVAKRINTSSMPEESGNSHRAVFFDVKVKSQPVVVTSIIGGFRAPGPIKVFVCKGSGVNKADNKDEWKLVAEGEFQERRTSEVRLFEPVHVPAHGSAGFYVHCEGGRVQCNRANEDGKGKGEVHRENEDVQLVLGGSHVQDEPFVDVKPGPMHIIAGGVAYNVGSAMFVGGEMKRLNTSTTPEDSGHSHRSVWFDVHAKGQKLTVLSLFGGYRAEGPISIFACQSGSGLHKASSPDEWKKVGEGNYEERKTTEIKLFEPVEVEAGTSVGIYVHCHGGRVQYNPADEDGKKLGDVHRENDDASLILGGCHLQDEPFINARGGPVHIIAGGIGYIAGAQFMAGIVKRIDTEMRPEDAGNSHRSVWFDVRAKGKPLRVVSLFGGVVEPGPIKVYACEGGGIHRATDRGAWKEVGAGTFEKRKTTELRLSTPLEVPKYGSVGIYVHCHGGRVQYNKPHRGNRGDVHRENEDVALINGGCHLQDEAFDNARDGPMHMLAGGVGYTIQGAGPARADGLYILNGLMEPPKSSYSARAVWFDVCAKESGISIESLFGGVHAVGMITVYSCEGSGINRANNADGWEVVSTGGFRKHEKTELRLDKVVKVAPFACRGFYLFCKGGRINLNDPHEGYRGDVHQEDDLVQLVYGGSHVGDKPFVNQREGPIHILAGSLGYKPDQQ